MALYEKSTKFTIDEDDNGRCIKIFKMPMAGGVFEPRCLVDLPGIPGDDAKLADLLPLDADRDVLEGLLAKITRASLDRWGAKVKP